MLPSPSSLFRLEYMVASLSSYSPDEFEWINFDISYPYLSPVSSNFRIIVSVCPLSRSEEILLGVNDLSIGTVYNKVLCLSMYYYCRYTITAYLFTVDATLQSRCWARHSLIGTHFFNLFVNAPGLQNGAQKLC